MYERIPTCENQNYGDASGSFASQTTSRSCLLTRLLQPIHEKPKKFKNEKLILHNHFHNDEMLCLPHFGQVS
ncbi:hypothetical protein Hanom_Chr13g01204261 [Helianthus anomalus]